MKKENKNLTSFVDHLDKQYGKRGTTNREKYEEEFEAFKLGVSLPLYGRQRQKHPNLAELNIEKMPQKMCGLE